jgi:diadenosine tetraphosphate (Ap4A) HIT family hydrolase
MPSDQVLLDNADALAFRDTFPLADGHTLVVPRRHLKSVFDGSATELASIWSLVAQVRQQLWAAFRPDGFTIGINNGQAAGQTVDHAHVHVIPRRAGDTADPCGGVRWVLPDKAPYWKTQT